MLSCLIVASLCEGVGLATLLFWLGRRKYVRVPPTRGLDPDSFYNVARTALTTKVEGRGNPGTLVASFCGVDAGKLPCPVMLIPGSLGDARLEQLINELTQQYTATYSKSSSVESRLWHAVFDLVKAFTAAVLGGIGSLPGAVIGGLLIGLIEVMWSAYFTIDYKDVAAFAILAIVLVFMPSGLLGRPEVEKV